MLVEFLVFPMENPQVTSRKLMSGIGCRVVDEELRRKTGRQVGLKGGFWLVGRVLVAFPGPRWLSSLPALLAFAVSAVPALGVH